MKSSASLLAGMACLAAVSLRAQTPPAAAPAAPVAPAAAPTLTDAQLVEEFGWFIAKRVGLPELQFSPDENAALVRGFSAALAGKDAPYDLQAAGPQMDALMQRKQKSYLDKVKTENSGASAAFFATLAQNKNIVALPDGMRYEIVQPGTGAFPTADSTVTVNYTGRLINGNVFDSSSRLGKPAQFPLSQVIKGWTEGIQKINKGGKIKLYIPADLAYGDQGRPGIPPNSTLIFDVELLDFTTPQAAAPAANPAPAAPETPAAQ